jgi:hypothetical protein
MTFNIRKLLFILVGFSLIIAIYFLPRDSNIQDTSNIPLILSESAETKVRPIEPGGVEFPNMDKSVYEYISPTQKPLRSEKLMPEPEQAVIKPQVDENISVFDEILNFEDKSNNSIFNETFSTNVTQPDDVNILTIDQTDNRLSEYNSSTSHHLGEKYLLQICASKTESQAMIEWNKSLKNNKDLVGNYDYKLSKIDLGDKGLIYKVYIGPFNTYNEANLLCKRLIKRKQACSVVNN